MGALGQTSLPSAALVDSNGIVVWIGHPGNLTDDVIEKHLEGALTTPSWSWPDSTKALKAALRKNELAKAQAEAAKLAANGDELLVKIEAAVKALTAGKAKAIQSTADRGDFLGAERLADLLGKGFKGLPEEVQLGECLTKMKADPLYKKVIKAQRSLAKIESEMPKLTRAKKIDEALDAIKKATSDVPGTYAADAGDKLAATLEKRKESLK